MSRFPAAYAHDAAEYDSRTASYARYRQMIVDEMPLRTGDTVIDAGCGTGLCFDAVQERIGPDGMLVGVDAAPDMLALAAERVAEAGWSNVVLTCAPLEDADLPQADHALFCAVHDVMQSGPALDNVLGHLRPGGSGGGRRQVGPGMGDRAERERAGAARAVRAGLRGLRPTVGAAGRARPRPRRARGRDGRGFHRERTGRATSSTLRRRLGVTGVYHRSPRGGTRHMVRPDAATHVEMGMRS